MAILAACHKYFACGNKVLFCSVRPIKDNAYRQDVVSLYQEGC